VKPAKKYRAPSEMERAALEDLLKSLEALPAGTDAEAIQTEVYEVGKRHAFADLKSWFQTLYETLLGQSTGPRMGSFIALYGLAESAALIRTVLAGKKYITPEIAQALAESLTHDDDSSMPHEKLSDREFQTLRLIASGKRLSEVAEALALSPKTVSVYRARILEKMNLTSNAEITHYALKHGLVK